MTRMPALDDAARIAAFLDSHTGWSAFWDKSYGVWRVTDTTNTQLTFMTEQVCRKAVEKCPRG